MKYIKGIIFCFVFVLGPVSNAQNVDLENVRMNYEKAVSDKKTCEEGIKELSTANNNSSVHLAYLGAFQTIWAKYTINPFLKLNTFKKGKKNIDAAVKAEPDNIEIRFIRLSIQKNSPVFLGYRDNIEEDKKFIQANTKNITSVYLKRMLAEII